MGKYDVRKHNLFPIFGSDGDVALDSAVENCAIVFMKAGSEVASGDYADVYADKDGVVKVSLPVCLKAPIDGVLDRSVLPVGWFASSDDKIDVYFMEVGEDGNPTEKILEKWVGYTTGKNEEFEKFVYHGDVAERSVVGRKVAGGGSASSSGLSTALDNNHYSVEIAGREYRCTKIGNQLWMSENLDAEVGTLGTSEETEGANEWYYNYDEAFAKSRNYGRLYTWDNLNTNLAGKLADWGLVTEDGKGWHLPSKEDFEKLMENIGAPYSEEDEGYLTAGAKLKSMNGWSADSDSKQGYDRYGFTALPAGERESEDFVDVGIRTKFLSSTSMHILACYYDYDETDIYPAAEDHGYSVRCVLDLNPDGTIPDDFKSFVKIKSASAAENLVQSNTIHTPDVFSEDDEGTPISQVFEQYKTSGSLRVLICDNSDTDVVCEATVNLIRASAGDTMMLWIDNPDVPNGKILYELDDGMESWPEPTYIEIASKDYVDGLVGKSFLITFDGTDGDKTQLEIYAAMSAGKVCLLYDSDWSQFAYGGLIGSGNTIYFYTTRPGSEGLICTEYSVTSSNAWVRRQVLNPGEAPVDNKAYGRWNGTWSEVALKTYVDGTRLQLASVSSASWTGAATASIDLDKLTDFGEIPAAVTGLTVNITAAAAPFVSQAAFQFSLPFGSQFSSLAVKLAGQNCHVSGMPYIWSHDKKYQATIVNGCCCIGEFIPQEEKTAEIGGREYKIVRIGGQVWMAENLDLKWDGLPINQSTASSTSPMAYYYNNDESTYGQGGSRECGLLYNWPAVKYLEDHKSSLIPGWHVPTFDEQNVLINYAGGASSAGKVLKKSGTIWGTFNFNGIDALGMSILPAGYRADSFSDIGQNTELWSVDEDPSDELKALKTSFTSLDAVTQNPGRKLGGFSLRLVKDM